jgi:hypothetical protein
LGHFFGYFLFGLEKKVPRLPDETGEVEELKDFALGTQHSALSSKILSTSKPTPAGRAPPGALLFLLAQIE